MDDFNSSFGSEDIDSGLIESFDDSADVSDVSDNSTDILESFNDIDSDNNVYQATPLDEIDIIHEPSKIEFISELQENLDEDIEPYRASNPRDLPYIDENGNVSTYGEIMDALNEDETSDTAPPKMSVEELLMSPEELAEHREVSDVVKMPESFDDIDMLQDTEEEQFEQSFAQRINSMSLEDLNAERERLIELGALDGNEIAERYDAFMADQSKKDEIDKLTNGFDKAELIKMKERVLIGDEELIKELGDNNDDSDDEGFQKVAKHR